MLLDRSYAEDSGGAFAALGRIPMFRDASWRDVRVSALSNSYTNSTFRVDFGGDSFLLRIPGDGTSGFVDRRSEEHNARIAAKHGVNAEVLFFDAGVGTMVCRFIEGAGVDAESFASDPASPARAADALRRTHRCGEVFASRFDPFERLEEYARALRRSRVRLPRDIGSTLDAARLIRRTLPSPSLAPCHNDPWPGNFVDSGNRMYLVDWEYSGMNDPGWDLADLSVEANFDPPGDRRFLEAYFGCTPPRDFRRRFESYKPVCDLLWALWGFLQTTNGNSNASPGDDFISYAVGRHEKCKARLAVLLATPAPSKRAARLPG